MTARAEAVERTRRAILDATIALHLSRPASSIGLGDVADRAGTSVQTILRHFGNRAALIETALVEAQQEVVAERRAPAGEVAAAVAQVVAHYEKRGDGVLVLLAQEGQEEFATRVVRDGRRIHRAWVREVFAPLLADRADADELVDLLVVATDVYTWKLLRRDRRRSRRATEAAVRRMVEALLQEEGA